MEIYCRQFKLSYHSRRGYERRTTFRNNSSDIVPQNNTYSKKRKKFMNGSAKKSWWRRKGKRLPLTGGPNNVNYLDLFMWTSWNINSRIFYCFLLKMWGIWYFCISRVNFIGSSHFKAGIEIRHKKWGSELLEKGTIRNFFLIYKK